MAVVLAGLLLLVLLPAILLSPGVDNGPVIRDRAEWVTFESEIYGFYLEHPPDWRSAELPEEAPVPGFNILPPEIDPDEFDVITHNTAVTNVSVFPRGYPTEGVFGQTRPSTAIFFEDVGSAIDHYLLNDEVWATMIIPEDPPAEWSPEGFIWTRVFINEHEVVCFDEGERISKESCDPALGHEIGHSGSIDPSLRMIQEEILRSFRFGGEN